MNLAAAKQAIWNWASVAATTSQAGTTTYWDNPDAPRPPMPAVRLKLIGGPQMQGLDEVQPSTASADAFNIVGPRTLTLSVTCYGDQAEQLASDLQTSLSDPNTAVTLDGANLASLTTSEIRDVSTVLDTRTEQRYQFDVEISATEVLAVAPGAIQEAKGTGAVSGGTAPVTGSFDQVNS